MLLDKLNPMVPAKARRFSADLEVGNNGDGAKTAPVRLVARSSEPVDAPYWGRVVHDLGGMALLKPRIPLDYCHDDYAIIGYANNFETSSGDLVANGALVPYTPDPCDKASEVIFKSQNGVPYEASIFFDGPLVIEDVDAGASTLVNGRQMDGPLMVVRKWTLRGIAICPHGVDPFTDSQMKFAAKGDVQATFVSKSGGDSAAQREPSAADVEILTKEKQMSESVEAEPKAVAAVETNSEPAKVEGAQAPAAVEAVATEMSQTAEAQPAPAAAVEVKTEPTKELAAPAPVAEAPGVKFLKTFGDKGGKWFAEGKTFEESQLIFQAELVAERDELSRKNAELTAQLVALRGEASPVSFSADLTESGPGKATAVDAAKARNLGAPLAKFAGTLNIPKTK